MKNFYGDCNYLPVLDEIEFWKRQEAEHTTVIRQILSSLERNFSAKLHEYDLAFKQAENKVTQLIETVIRSQGQLNQMMMKHINDVIAYSIKQSKQFGEFLKELMLLSQVKNNPVAKTIINHIIRESEYFIGIVQTVMSV